MHRCSAASYCCGSLFFGPLLVWWSFKAICSHCWACWLLVWHSSESRHHPWSSETPTIRTWKCNHWKYRDRNPNCEKETFLYHKLFEWPFRSWESHLCNDECQIDDIAIRCIFWSTGIIRRRYMIVMEQYRNGKIKTCWLYGISMPYFEKVSMLLEGPVSSPKLESVFGAPPTWGCSPVHH